MVVISDGRYVYAVIANMLITAVTMGATFRGMFVPFKTYGYFLGEYGFETMV